MKREALNFVAVIGLVFLGAAVVLGILTGLLFIFPKMSILGAKSVNERDTEIVYEDEVLADAFANGKFILESSGTQIEVKMSSEGYKWQNNIVVHESATGISFNSLNRTLIQWTQTLYGDNNDVYYRIKVLEPSGMVFNSAATVVYINLPYRNDGFRYDFVLQNHYSNVNFSFIDETTTENDALLLDNLVVENAASVNIPYNQKSSVKNVVVQGNNTKVTCESQVMNNVTVIGNNNVLKFGHEDDASITGNVLIQGNNNSFAGTSASRVEWKANMGNLSMSKSIGSLDVETISAAVSANSVIGGVKMTTQSGSLNVASVGAGVNFTAGSESAPFATASLNVEKVTGTTVVNNYGFGTVTVHNANGDVSIRSAEVAGGAIDVSFADASAGNNLTIVGYDGRISASNINGGNVNISVVGGLLRAGYANVEVNFKQVGNVVIRTGSYPDGGKIWGNVEIKLNEACNNFNLYVYYARSVDVSETYNPENKNILVNQNEDGIQSNQIVTNGDDGVVGTMKIYSQTNVYLS